MESLSRLVEPFSAKIRSLPSGSRVTGIVFGLSIAAGLWLMLGTAAPTAYEPLLGDQDLSAPQIARIMAAFEKHGLSEAHTSGASIEIPSHRKNAYLVAVSAEDAWPANFDAPVGRALAETSPWLPGQQNRESVELGEKQMLARIVEEMAGIESAAVQYDEIRLSGFPPKIEVRAMVAVKATDRRNLEFEEIEAIRNTVVAYKSGLDRSSVTITDLNACRAYPGESAPAASEFANRANAATKRALEQEYEEKIRQHMSMYPDLRVAVTANLAKSSTEAPTEQASPDGIQLQEMTASISIPRHYFTQVWKQRLVANRISPPTARELHEIEQEVTGTIQRAVTALLPPTTADQRAGRESVTVTAHDDITDIASAPAPVVSETWYLYTAGGVVLAVLILMGIVRGRRKHVHRNVVANESIELKVFPPSRDGGEEVPDSTVDDVKATPTDVENQLTDLVQRDPAAAAEILKQWLKRAA